MLLVCIHPVIPRYFAFTENRHANKIMWPALFEKIKIQQFSFLIFYELIHNKDIIRFKKTSSSSFTNVRSDLCNQCYAICFQF